jgi:hypothetical protein
MWVYYATSSALIKIMTIGTCNSISEENKTKPAKNRGVRSSLDIRRRGPLSYSTGSQQATLLHPSYENTAGDHGPHRGGWHPSEHTRSQERLSFPANFSIPLCTMHVWALASSLTPVSRQNPSFGCWWKACKCLQTPQVPSRQPNGFLFVILKYYIISSLGQTFFLCDVL